MTGQEAPETSVVISDPGDAAEILHTTRLTLGLKQEDVAEKAGFARRTLYKLETERRSPNLSTLIPWAAALGMIVRLEQSEEIAAQLAATGADAELLARTRTRLESGAAERIRLDAQVTQTAIAEAIGCAQSVIAKWESKKHVPRPSGLFLAYGRLLDALAAGEQLDTSRSFGHDMLGVRLDNLLRREGISRERAQAMTDAELRALPGLGARAVRRIREWSATSAAPAVRADGCRRIGGTWVHRQPHTCPTYLRGGR